MDNEPDETRLVQVTAPGGVIWTRRPGGLSTGAQLLGALSVSTRMHTDVELLWNWWEEDRHSREQSRVWAILEEWENGADQREQTDEEVEAFVQRWNDEQDAKREAEKKRRAELVAQSYDKDRASARLQLLRKEADAAFFQHVADKPANAAQREDAERRAARCKSEAEELRKQVGDPEDVLDERGYLPAERRKQHLDEHMRYWRYPALRELRKRGRRRFTALLNMPVPEVARMCSECQAPAEWHEYDISLCLFRSPPAKGSQAEVIARLMPGWWERCHASTSYAIGHGWGEPHALPDFTGEQWQAMLPPLLRSTFAPEPIKKKPAKPKPQPLATIPPGPIADVMAKLQELQAKYPTAEVRQGNRGRWELWPAKGGNDT
ncbi:hypothetical protein [Amycolatopsis dendrobii]|uniref:Uncharacterized protein n=1 Tax=Amycolatopsis dendrobii TaxID=2760662 RepID=A0A7W3VTD8_9PSEU|nr:hypothetical protein [Amycolatopsis dendrobii]MBB1152497.1 hypothetical protein [Amycolatopsis dendrobii]